MFVSVYLLLLPKSCCIAVSIKMKIVKCMGTKLRNNLCTGIKWKLFSTEIMLKFSRSVNTNDQ